MRDDKRVNQVLVIYEQDTNPGQNVIPLRPSTSPMILDKIKYHQSSAIRMHAMFRDDQALFNEF